ncbi:MAG: hypothetical protein L6R40_006005 [Gallowayella cf. fulva]|nr:MAG: hypothetical protein L6R40_006005 [Xanthomendoza cf. fulva]
MLIAIILSFLLASADATPVTTKAISFFENFDSPPNGNPLVPVASNVGNTAGGALKYNAFAYSDHSTTALTLKVPCQPYCIGSGVTAQTTQGQPGWGLINSTYVSNLSDLIQERRNRLFYLISHKRDIYTPLLAPLAFVLFLAGLKLSTCRQYKLPLS